MPRAQRNTSVEVSIFTEYVGMTTRRPARISVQGSGNKKKFYSQNECQDLAIKQSGNSDASQVEIHFEAAKKYIAEIGYKAPKEMVVGGSSKGFVFLFDTTLRLKF